MCFIQRRRFLDRFIRKLTFTPRCTDYFSGNEVICGVAQTDVGRKIEADSD